VTALFCAAGLARAGTADAAELLYGVDAQNRLVSFTSDRPNAISRTAFVGLPAGEQILGLDVRPAGNLLIALSSASRLYRIEAATGQATAIGTTAFSPALNGTTFGFDFNPTVDRIRVTADRGQNLGSTRTPARTPPSTARSLMQRAIPAPARRRASSVPHTRTVSRERRRPSCSTWMPPGTRWCSRIHRTTAPS